MAYFPIFTQIDGKRCLIAGGGKVAARKVYTLLQYGADVVVMAEKVCGEIKEVLPEENVFEGVFKYIHKNRCNKNEWDIDENKYDTGGNISNTELENTLDKRYSSNSNLKNISYDLEISENLLESLSADLSEDLLKIRKNTFLEKEIGKAFLVVAATSNREENHHIAELCHAYNVLVNVADSEEESSFIFPSVVRKGDISIGINSGTGSPTVSKHIRKQIEKAVPDYYADIAVFMGKLREYVKANFKEESQRRYILKTAAAEAFAEESSHPKRNRRNNKAGTKMIELVEDKLDIDTYLELRQSVNFRKLTRDQAKKGLSNSMYTLVAFKDGKAVGMGRIVGDGAIICYVQDLIIRPEVQGEGIGGLILETLKKFVIQEGYEGTTMMFDLMCAKGREEFYKKHGFIARPTEDLGPGMIQFIQIGEEG